MLHHAIEILEPIRKLKVDKNVAPVENEIEQKGRLLAESVSTTSAMLARGTQHM